MDLRKPIWSILTVLAALALIVEHSQSKVTWEVQRYDGWYNNLAHHRRGAVGSPLVRLLPARYSDGVLQPLQEPQLPNPRRLSDVTARGPSGLPSAHNQTVLSVFFGYHVVFEMLDSRPPGCPPEFMHIPVPEGDPVFDPHHTGRVLLPFQRGLWDKHSSQSPNNPRTQVNLVTAWLDGSSIYGPSSSWSDALRSFSGGLLASGEQWDMPKRSGSSNMMWSAADPSTELGNAWGNENVFTMAEGIVWFRYHNYIASQLCEKHPSWSDEDLFQNARKTVVATFQNIAFYEWLPVFLGEKIMPPYKETELVTFRRLSTSMGARRQRCACATASGTVRTPNLKSGQDIDHLIMGMASQIAEREDNIVVEDLRDYMYGPLRFSRSDLVALTVQRGRDFGLPSYNLVREGLGLAPVERWGDINPRLNTTNPQLFRDLADLYDGDISKLELFPGGLLESVDGPGPVFSSIILDQFDRIRNGDRFWFENTRNGMFTAEEVQAIRNTTFHDVITAVTSAEAEDIQRRVFFWRDACEWQGPKKPLCPVSLLIDDRRRLQVFDRSGPALRSLSLGTQTHLDVLLSSDHYRRALLLKVPKEYDLVLYFEDEGQRGEFVRHLRSEVTDSGQELAVRDMTEKELLREAVTRDQRAQIVETFIRTAFAKVLEIEKCDARDLSGASCRKTREALETELTGTEFADALGLKPDSLFVDSMSFIEISSSLLSKSQAEEAIKAMLKAAGFNDKEQITWEDFHFLLRDHEKELTFAQLNIKGMEKEGGNRLSRHQHVSFITPNRNSSPSEGDTQFSSSLGKDGQELRRRQGKRSGLQRPKVYVKPKKERYNRNPIQQKIQHFKRFVENYRRHIVCFTIVYGITAGAYSTGVPETSVVGILVSRGSAAAISFLYPYMLLTVCRNLITFGRETFLNQYIPFDAAIDFHRFMAMSALLFSVIHSLGHVVNVYVFSVSDLSILACLFPRVLADNGSESRFEMVVVVLSDCFPTVIHGSYALLQQPRFYIYLIPPGLLFLLDKLISLNRKKVEIAVVNATLLPSGVTNLEFKRPQGFVYRSGQWVRVACLALGTDEYHPFTLTSAPHEETLSLHIRALYLDGPFGEGHQEWTNFEVSVLVGGGIGVTPFASILKDLVFKSSVKFKIQCKKVYFIWVTRTQRQFEWVSDIIREVEEQDSLDLVSVHIYITQLAEKFDLRTTMLKVWNRSLFTGLRSVTHFGRPPFVSFFSSLQEVHPEVGKIGVFSCGPPGLTKNVEKACQQMNKGDQTHFIHHYENF
ncbi:unnamed protein product [Coregonus sp. 'balchen']|nr:unnamed protein product [Coregonus sp. 'balchen']